MVIKRRYQSDTNPGRARRSGYHRRSTRRRRAFLLLMVTVVITLASLAALNFSRSMLISHEVAVISRARLQAQMAAESHAQAIRLLLAYPPAERLSMGGTWNNPTWFQAVNVVADPDPARRVNVTVLAPSLDDMGNLSGLRYGLQNESAKLNLNALVQLDALAAEMNAATNAAWAGGASRCGCRFGRRF
ncbi:MAG: hypothetical protein KatS3mg111_0168 [Pirellulaceae bacterium]|nr:MAG: hypothetical protein KatS3mg111_0168 [Pirellulaceae bacterium]